MEKEQLIQAFSEFNKLNVVVIGDAMIDHYIWGSSRQKTSPEAPIPLIAVEGKEIRLGGAANVAKNLKAMGASPFLISLIGADTAGNNLSKLLSDNQLSNEYIITDNNRITTLKMRLFSGTHPIIRVDEESTEPIAKAIEASVLSNLDEILATKKIDLILFVDYDKGLLTPSLISQIIKTARQKNIRTAVDPKFKNFSNYKGVDLFKPNFNEFCAGVKKQLRRTDSTTILPAANQFREQQQIEKILITLSEAGTFISEKNGAYHFPAHSRAIKDVSGAGDTVFAVAGLALAAGLSSQTIAFLSNIAGGLVCEKLGVVAISKEKLQQEAIKNFSLKN